MLLVVLFWWQVPVGNQYTYCRLDISCWNHRLGRFVAATMRQGVTCVTGVTTTGLSVTHETVVTTRVSPWSETHVDSVQDEEEEEESLVQTDSHLKYIPLHIGTWSTEPVYII